jgi:3-deoxy-manno-octulosonate cytidylyltransferase (CMP-KDO synthetase)
VTPDRHIVAVIPARMGSSRFPGKPLAGILGLPMIEHVYRRTAMCDMLQDVYVATCDQEIHDVVDRFGGRAMMTSPSHERASDRVAEAAQHLQADIIVMVQGDEPMTVPEMIDDAVAPVLNDPKVGCVNLVKRINGEEEYLDRNTIKVVMNQHKDALYFSRETVPSSRVVGFGNIAAFKQVCIIPFRRDLLLKYARLEPSRLEQAESIDMLRLLEHGYKVRLVETAIETHAVDTAQDLKMVEELMRDDPRTKRYLNRSAGGSGS